MNDLLTIDKAWQNLQEAINALERRQGQWEVLAATCQAAIQLLLEFEPGQILERIQSSELPPRATVSWLVFEAAKMKDLDQDKVRALATQWRLVSGQDLIAPPPGAKSEPFLV